MALTQPAGALWAQQVEKKDADKPAAKAADKDKQKVETVVVTGIRASLERRSMSSAMRNRMSMSSLPKTSARCPTKTLPIAAARAGRDHQLSRRNRGRFLTKMTASACAAPIPA